MAKFCGNCGNQLADTDIVCGRCGTPLQAPQAAAPVAPAPAYQPAPQPAPQPAAPKMDMKEMNDKMESTALGFLGFLGVIFIIAGALSLVYELIMGIVNAADHGGFVQVIYGIEGGIAGLLKYCFYAAITFAANKIIKLLKK